jgi:hypothetical protein
MERQRSLLENWNGRRTNKMKDERIFRMEWVAAAGEPRFPTDDSKDPISQRSDGKTILSVTSSHWVLDPMDGWIGCDAMAGG